MSRNEPRNACNASNFTPTDSRPDSMFDCARGLRSNYARFSRVRSAKELTFSTFTIPFVICFRPTIAFRDYKFPPTVLITLVRTRSSSSSSSIDPSIFFFFQSGGKKIIPFLKYRRTCPRITNLPSFSNDVRVNTEIINYPYLSAVTRPLSRYHILISWNISRVSRWTFSLTSLCIYIEANSTGKSNLEEDYARERENLFLIGFELLRGIYIYICRKIYEV